MPIRRTAAATISAVVLCQAFHTLTFAGLSLFLPLIREDLGMSFSEAGILSAAATLTYGLGQVPAGYLADRFGPRRLFFIGLIGWSLLSLTLALLHSFWGAVVNQLGAGALRAMLFAPGLTLLASWFPPQRRATAMSLYMVGGFAGNVALSLAGPLLAANFGWRTTFGAFALVGILSALGYWAVAAEKPRGDAHVTFGISEALRLLREPIIWICSAIQFIRFSVVTSTMFWLPMLLVSDRGFTLQQAGFCTALSAAFSAPSNALGGYVSDRINNPPLVIGTSLGILACTSVLLVTVETTPPLLLVIAVNSMFMQFYFGPLFLVPVETLGTRSAGTATGFGNLFANFGGFVTAYALGATRDLAGTFKWGYVGVGVLCLIGVALSVLLASRRRRFTIEQRALAFNAPAVARK